MKEGKDSNINKKQQKDEDRKIQIMKYKMHF